MLNFNAQLYLFEETNNKYLFDLIFSKRFRISQNKKKRGSLQGMLSKNDFDSAYANTLHYCSIQLGWLLKLLDALMRETCYCAVQEIFE